MLSGAARSSVPAWSVFTQNPNPGYSSDIADVLKRDYYNSRQDQLKAELDRKVSAVIDRPEFKSAYKRLREDQESYFG